MSKESTGDAESSKKSILDVYESLASHGTRLGELDCVAEGELSDADMRRVCELLQQGVPTKVALSDSSPTHATMLLAAILSMHESNTLSLTSLQHSFTTVIADDASIASLGDASVRAEGFESCWVWILKEQVKKAFSSKSYRRAIALLTELLLYAPKNSPQMMLLLIQRGQCRTEIPEERDAAYADYDAVLEINPKHDQTLYLRSVLSRKLDRQTSELPRKLDRQTSELLDLERAVQSAPAGATREKYAKRLAEVSLAWTSFVRETFHHIITMDTRGAHLQLDLLSSYVGTRRHAALEIWKEALKDFVADGTEKSIKNVRRTNRKLDVLEVLSEQIWNNVPNMGDPAFPIEVIIQINSFIHANAPARSEMAAINLSVLGDVYYYRIEGEKKENLETSIEFQQQAFDLFTSLDHPLGINRTSTLLGHAYCDRIEGDKSENIEKGIAYLHQAIKVVSAVDHRLDLVRALYRLSQAYTMRLKGSKSENIESALQHQKLACKLHPEKKTDPRQWANNLLSLGFIYYERCVGNRARNLAKAIDCCTNCTSFFTKRANPVDWAAAMIQLGACYFEGLREGRGSYIEALDYFEQALTLFPEEPFPLDWCKVLLRICNSFSQYLQESCYDKFISRFEDALTVCTETLYPKKWAETMTTIGIMHLERFSGDRRTNIEKAIGCFQNALRVFTEQLDLYLHAYTTTRLGMAFCDRIAGNRSSNIETAISHFEHARPLFNEQDEPVNTALAQYGLGLAYSERLAGNLSDNLKKSIEYLEQSLTVFTKEKYRHYWAKSLMVLAHAYCTRWDGNAPDATNAVHSLSHSGSFFQTTDSPQMLALLAMKLGHARMQCNFEHIFWTMFIESSMGLFQDALKGFHEREHPYFWAQTMALLGKAYHLRTQGDKSDNVEQAITCLQKARGVFQQQEYPLDWARTGMSLGAAYIDRIEGDTKNNIERAIGYLEGALAVFNEYPYFSDWVSVNLCLGKAYCNRVEGDQRSNIATSLTYFQQALNSNEQGDMTNRLVEL